MAPIDSCSSTSHTLSPHALFSLCASPPPPSVHLPFSTLLAFHSPSLPWHFPSLFLLWAPTDLYDLCQPLPLYHPFAVTARVGLTVGGAQCTQSLQHTHTFSPSLRVPTQPIPPRSLLFFLPPLLPPRLLPPHTACWGWGTLHGVSIGWVPPQECSRWRQQRL